MENNDSYYHCQARCTAAEMDGADKSTAGKWYDRNSVLCSERDQY